MIITRFCNECGSKNTIDDSKVKFFCSICGAENILDQSSQQVKQHTDPKQNEKQHDADSKEPSVKTISGFAPPPKNQKTFDINTSNLDSKDGNPTVPVKVQDVVDTNLPNIYFDYKTTNNNVKMQIKVLCLGKTYDFSNGDSIEIYIPEGKQVVHFKIGSQNYVRTITIQKGVVIHLNCAWNGHAEIKTDIPACIHVGDYYVQQEIIAKQKSGMSAGAILGVVFGVLALVLLVFFLIIGIGAYLNRAKTAASRVQNTSATTAHENSNSAAVTQNVINETTEKQLPFTVAGGTTNLSVGEIAKEGDCYYGLACVRSLDRVQSALDYYSEDISSSKEVIYPIFEVYNGSSDENSFNKREISIYADSVKGSDPDIDLLVGVDDINEWRSYEVDPGKTALIVVAFVVDRGWSDLTVYWGDISWKLTPDDVSSEPFVYSPLYDLSPDYSFTNKEAQLYNGDYELIFDGLEIYKESNSYSSSTKYVVFEFTINNTSDATIDYSSVGHEMKAYWNNLLLHSASYDLTDNVNGYMNVYYVDEIHAGMTAKVYVAFEITEESGVFECFYDVGYVSNERIGYVCVEK